MTALVNNLKRASRPICALNFEIPLEAEEISKVILDQLLSRIKPTDFDWWVLAWTMVAQVEFWILALVSDLSAACRKAAE